MLNNTATPGLGNAPKSEWQGVTARQSEIEPIKRLVPKSELHSRVRAYLNERIRRSERKMNDFYARWASQEQRFQAYIDLEQWEQNLQQMNDSGKKPAVVSITVPYAFSTVMTIVTYLIHTFAGRKPIFQVSSNKSEFIPGAQMMEIVLQYNADRTRLIRHLFQFLNDGEIYGLGVLRTAWKEEKKLRTVHKRREIGGQIFNKFREERTVYAGNDVLSIDPYNFFPDPSVPMERVNRDGEFVFWRTYPGKHEMLKAQAQGEFMWINHAGQMPSRSEFDQNPSSRSIRSGGESHPSNIDSEHGDVVANRIQLDQGTVEIIPKELGLGDSEIPEKWLFSIANGNQVVQARPFEADHDMHPVVVSEPYSLGYGFGNLGAVDYLAPIQDSLSWLINSHIDNVRTVLNDMIVVDPSMIEMQDLKNPEPGKLIRLKQAAMGRDIRSVIQQLQVTDVTRGHIKDFELLMRIGDGLSAVNDNLRGLFDSGGRKTATEVRTSGEAGASRLAAHARFISSQSIVDLVEQMSLNIQQYLDDEFYYNITGMEGLEKSIIAASSNGGVNITPEMLVGDFNYPINDGTLPLDRVALLDVWREIFVAVAQDQELRGTFSLPKIFEHIAELGGAKNIEAMKVDLRSAPDGAIAAAAQAGNAVPVGGAASGNPTGTPPNPGARAAGAL